MKSQKMQTIALICKLYVSLVLVLFLLVPMQDALAQEESDEAYSGVLEEVMVTSRRYVESIGDVPVSVNVMTAEDLEAGGLTNVSN